MRMCNPSQQPDGFDPYRKLLGIPCKHSPPDHYRLLALERFEEDADVINTAADARMVHLRNYQMGEHAASAERILNEVAAARLCLLDPDRKANYDRFLRAYGTLLQPGQKDPGDTLLSEDDKLLLGECSDADVSLHPGVRSEAAEGTKPDAQEGTSPNERTYPWNREIVKHDAVEADEALPTARDAPKAERGPSAHPLPLPGRTDLDDPGPNGPAVGEVLPPPGRTDLDRMHNKVATGGAVRFRRPPLPGAHSQKATARKRPPPLLPHVHLKMPVCDTGNTAIGKGKSETKALVWITGSAVAVALVLWVVFLTIVLVWTGCIPKARFGPGNSPPELNRHHLINASIYTMIGVDYRHYGRGPRFASLGTDRRMLSRL